jgi:hypothetical protein
MPSYSMLDTGPFQRKVRRGAHAAEVFAQQFCALSWRLIFLVPLRRTIRYQFLIMSDSILSKSQKAMVKSTSARVRT